MNFLPDGSVREFLEASMAILEDECRPAFIRLCGTLAGQALRFEIEGESIYLSFSSDQVLFLPWPPESCLEIATSKAAIIQLVDGELTLYEAVALDKMAIRGETREIAKFYDGLMLYLKGAVRCPTFPRLLDRFRY